MFHFLINFIANFSAYYYSISIRGQEAGVVGYTDANTTTATTTKTADYTHTIVQVDGIIVE